MGNTDTQKSLKELWVKRDRIVIAGLMVIFLTIILYFVIESSKPVVIEFAMFNGSNWDVEIQDSYSFIDRAIKRFEEEHPGVKVHYVSGIPKEDYSEWLSGKILKGYAPDVMMLKDEDFNRFAELEILQELNPYLEKDTGFDSKRYYETALKSGKIGDVQYALPFETVPYLMFVNKTLLNKEKIDIPDNDYTFEDLYSICERITKDLDGDGIIDQFGIFKYSWQDAAISNGVKLFSADGKQCYFTSNELQEAIKFTKSLNDLNGNQKITQELFDKGKVAFMPLTYAEYRTYKAYPYKVKKYTDFQWDCITLPKGKRGSNSSVVDSLNIGMSKDSKYKELSWEFLKYMTGDEKVQQDMFLNAPAASVLHSVTENKSLGKDIDGEFVGKVIDGGTVKPKFENYQGAIQIADAEINKLYTQDTDLDNAMRIIQRKVQEYISK